MKKIYLNPLAGLFLAVFALGLASCAEDTSTTGPKGTTSLTMSSSNAAHSTGTAAFWRRVNQWIGIPSAKALDLGVNAFGQGIVIDDFQVSIREVKFKSSDDTGTDLAQDSVDFQGPFALDLLDDVNGPLAQTLGDAEIPAGTYDGIRFVLHKADATAAGTTNLTDRSVNIAGTIDFDGPGAATPEPFVMWHDTGENFDLFGTNGIVIESGDTGNSLNVDFKLLSIIDGIDFTGVDTAEDIFPNAATQANKDVADLLKDNIKLAADFGKDEDGDGVVSEDEDVD